MNSNSRRDSIEAGRAPLRRRLALPIASLAGVLAWGSAALAQETPPLDGDIQFMLDNGANTIFFAQTCRSIGPDGEVIDVEPLPVGGGFVLECETVPVAHLQGFARQSSTGENFCGRGQLFSFVAKNVDPRLSVSVASSPDGAPWVLVGTSEEEITITKVTNSDGLTIFPMATDAFFDVSDVQPNPTGSVVYRAPRPVTLAASGSSRARSTTR
jgi:hypothetical protein